MNGFRRAVTGIAIGLGSLFAAAQSIDNSCGQSVKAGKI